MGNLTCVYTLLSVLGLSLASCIYSLVCMLGSCAYTWASSHFVELLGWPFCILSAMSGILLADRKGVPLDALMTIYIASIALLLLMKKTKLKEGVVASLL